MSPTPPAGPSPVDPSPADPGADPEARWVTIDELAHAFGVPVSTLRMYQHRGLIPPPVKRGRVGFYGPDHAARLRLLAELQERGFSLAGIKELLDGWQRGRSLDDLLGVSGAVGAWAPEPPLVLAPEELAGRFPGVDISPALMVRVFEMGLAELTDDGRIRVNSPRFLETGTRLAALGVPIDEIIDEYAVLRATTDAIATQFTMLFRRHLWASFAAAGLPAERVAEITAALAELGPLAQSIVEVTLRASLQDAAQAFLDEQAEALSAAPAPGTDPGAPAKAVKRKAGGPKSAKVAHEAKVAKGAKGTKPKGGKPKRAKTEAAPTAELPTKRPTGKGRPS